MGGGDPQWLNPIASLTSCGHRIGGGGATLASTPKTLFFVHHRHHGGATGQGMAVLAPTPALGLDQQVIATRVVVHRIGGGGAPSAAPQA